MFALYAFSREIPIIPCIILVLRKIFMFCTLVSKTLKLKYYVWFPLKYLNLSNINKYIYRAYITLVTDIITLITCNFGIIVGGSLYKIV